MSCNAPSIAAMPYAVTRRSPLTRRWTPGSTRSSHRVIFVTMSSAMTINIRAGKDLPCALYAAADLAASTPGATPALDHNGPKVRSGRRRDHRPTVDPMTEVAPERTLRAAAKQGRRQCGGGTVPQDPSMLRGRQFTPYAQNVSVCQVVPRKQLGASASFYIRRNQE